MTREAWAALKANREAKANRIAAMLWKALQEMPAEQRAEHIAHLRTVPQQDRDTLAALVGEDSPSEHTWSMVWNNIARKHDYAPQAAAATAAVDADPFVGLVP